MLQEMCCIKHLSYNSLLLISVTDDGVSRIRVKLKRVSEVRLKPQLDTNSTSSLTKQKQICDACLKNLRVSCPIVRREGISERIRRNEKNLWHDKSQSLGALLVMMILFIFEIKW